MSRPPELADDDELDEDELQGEVDAFGNSAGIEDEARGGAYSIHCRMYENEFPEIDEIVMVQVRSIAEMGAYVALLEYNNIEGMILHSELTRRRIRSINKLIRVGKTEVCMVLRVDHEKGYIDLSKRRVSAEDVKRCTEKFERSKTVHSIMAHVSKVQHLEMEQVYAHTAWRLYEKFGHAYEAFRAAISDPDSIFNEETTPGLEAELRAVLLKNIVARLTPTALKIRADFEVTCFQYEGINAIKQSLMKGVDMGNEDMPIKIKLVAPPLYVMLCSAFDKDKGIAVMSDAIKVMTDEIDKCQGALTVKMAPRAVDEKDDKLLSNLMESLEAQNREIEGDDDEEEDESMGSGPPGV